MHYKTTIEIITKAQSKHDAADICGEYLRGAIEEGPLFMRVRTNKLNAHRMRTTAAVIFMLLLFTASGYIIGKNRVYHSISVAEKHILTRYAMQPPLATDVANPDTVNFKKQWIKEYHKRAAK